MTEELPKDTKLAGKIIEGNIRREQTKTDRGFIGNLFGSKENVVFNVAAVISIVCAFCFITVVILWGGKEDFTHKDAISALSGLLTLALGYLIGRGNRE